MNSLYIYHQTQIGDHILCYSIVKHYSKLYDRVFVVVRNLGDRHMQNIKTLYSTLPNVSALIFNSHNEVLTFININKENNYLVIGHEDYRKILATYPDTVFDTYFYEKAKIPFDNKWSEFVLTRNIKKEIDIYHNVLKLSDGEDYIFLQEDTSRNFRISRKYINPNIRIIESSKFLEVNIFDFLYTIEKAKEVHVINSSFLTLVDILQLRNDEIYYHQYVRPSIYEQPHLKLNWNIIKQI